jgi:hypothetical protein
MSKHWTANEISYLKRFAASKRISDLAQRFHAQPEEVRGKLAELKLASKEGAAGPTSAADPMLGVFEAGLKALYTKRWAEAEEKLEKVASNADLLDLKSRARQMLAACRERRAAPEKGGASDPYLTAVVLKNRGEYEEALALASRGGAASDERFLYLTASIYSLTDRPAEAAKALARAIEANPVNRVHAFHDPDFTELRRHQDHAHLFGLA